MNPNANVSEDILKCHAVKGDNVKLILKNKEAYIGGISRKEEGGKWCIQAPESKIAGTMMIKEVLFDIQDVESVQIIR